MLADLRFREEWLPKDGPLADQTILESKGLDEDLKTAEIVRVEETLGDIFAISRAGTNIERKD